MKKYLILAAAAAVALASCAKVETYKVSENDGEMPIAFSNYAPKSLTKADGSYVASTTLVNGKKFGVYSYATANGTAFATSSAGALGTQFMNGVEVTYATGGDSDATKNTYSPLRYWPSGDTPDWLTFWAYYPVQADNGISYAAPTGSNGLGVYTFTAAATPAAMVDFMVADAVNDKIYGTATGEHIAVNGVVPFTFKHQLTKVQFKFKKATGLDAGTTIKLVDAELVNIKTEGTLSATYATGATTTTWSAQAIAATPITYDVTLNTSDPESGSEITLTETANTVAPADIFLMVPQTMIAKDGTNPQYLEVTWQVITDGKTTTNTKKLYLDECVNAEGGDTQANIDWNKNNFVTYTITIGPKPIRFTATVTGWDAEQNAYFDVQ